MVIIYSKVSCMGTKGFAVSEALNIVRFVVSEFMF